ncbi:hypothetical protein GS532_22660 [Rhodococcus hoagii]|nr:hypothetical protein [Prescottella equi]
MTIEISDGRDGDRERPEPDADDLPGHNPWRPITVPVQGGLTAEQLAHIVATVTAKVVEELGGQPGNVSWEAVQGKPAAFPPEAQRHTPPTSTTYRPVVVRYRRHHDRHRHHLVVAEDDG